MMKHYDSYKDSGIEWIGETPSHWEVKRVGSVFSQRNEVVSDTDYQPLSVTKNGIVPQMEGVAKTDNNDNRKLVLNGDYVINSRSDRKGSSGLSYLDGSVSVINIVLYPFGIYPKITPYVFKSYDFIEEYFRNGKGIVWDLWSTRFNEMKNILLPLPPLSEQEHIVSYLDDKTTKIDELIQKKLRKIDLLKEYRTSLINTVVTKGLNPNVPMKDSGIDWIGEIPSHWNTVKLKQRGEVVIGLSYSPENIVEEGDGVLVMRSSNVQNGKPSFTDNVYVNSDIPNRMRLLEGDILICSRNGSRNLIGKNCLITKNEVGMAFGVFMTVYRSIFNRLIYWILNSPVFESQSGLYLTSTINQLTVYTLQNMTIPFVDDHDEQEQIVTYLNEKTSQIDKTIDIEKKKIELLKEYRQSLISSVVTGKIKVTE